MTLRARVLPRFPATVEVTDPVTLTKTGLTYTFGVNDELSALGSLTGTGFVSRTGDGTYAVVPPPAGIPDIAANSVLANPTGALAQPVGVPLNQSLVFSGGAMQISGLPPANGTVTLGSALQQFAGLYLAASSEIRWNDTDVRIQHATDQLNFVGGATGYFFDAALKPITNDGAALGAAAVAWADLFLASGAVINFAGGDVTITHAANALAFGGADNGYTFDRAVAVTSNVSTALAVGRQGVSNPALVVDASAASSLTGLRIAAQAAGANVNLVAVSSGTNEGLTIDSKGSGTLFLQNSGTGNIFCGRPLDISSANCGQIIFPATQNSHAGANVLDDYEEGTFTPAVEF